MNEEEEVRALHVLIPRTLHQRFKIAAAKQDRSLTAETRRALEEHLQRLNSEGASE